MKTFQEFLLESEKFETMYDLEGYIQGRFNPDTFKKAIDFYHRLPNVPNILVKAKLFQGKFDTLLADVNDTKYRIEFDYPRRLIKLYIVEDEKEDDTFYKAFAFQELFN